jgi:hypothetical protein
MAAVVWGVVWFLTYFGARAALEAMNTGADGYGRLAVAIVPLVPFVLFLWFFIRGLRQGDELQRRIQLEALAIAFPLSILLLMILGLVQLATPLNPDDWSYRHVWPLLPLFWFGGQMIARRKYL